jgi:hypothetical protein
MDLEAPSALLCAEISSRLSEIGGIRSADEGLKIYQRARPQIAITLSLNQIRNTRSN